MEQFYTIYDIAILYKVHHMTIRKDYWKGKIKASKMFGRSPRFNESAIKAYHYYREEKDGQ